MSNSYKANWLDILCPLHNDRHFGSAGINMDTGVIHCFSCTQSIHILSLAHKQFPDLTGQALLDFLGVDGLAVQQQYLDTRFSDTPVAPSKKILGPKKKRVITREFCLLQYSAYAHNFDPDTIDYTKQRGISKCFLKFFDIKLITEGYFRDYMVTPIVDTLAGVHTIELRRIKNRRPEVRKVLYPSGDTSITKTIFNRDNLSVTEDLFVTEGIAGTAKIWEHISRNVTSIFGVNVSPEQIDLLRNFSGKKIAILDGDKASWTMLKTLNAAMENWYVVPGKCKDESSDYVPRIKGIHIPLSEYLIYGRNFTGQR